MNTISKKLPDSTKVPLILLLGLATFHQISSANFIPVPYSRAAPIRFIEEPLQPCGPIFFAVGSSKIDSDQRACLEEIATVMRIYPDILLVVDGHSRPSERKAVAMARAEAARDYLVKEWSLDTKRLVVRNFGSGCLHESGELALDGRVEFSYLSEGKDVKTVQKRCKPRRKT